MPILSSGRGRSFSCAAALLLASLTAPPARAQTPPPQPPPAATETGFRLKKSVELVEVHVTVTDARGNFLAGLKRENFRILDNGREQAITHFAPVEEPALVLVLVETSPAVYMIHRQHLEAAHGLLEGLAADDRVALASYDQAARQVLSFTADKGALYGALVSLRYNLGMPQLNLLQSMGTALDWLAPIPGKK